MAPTSFIPHPGHRYSDTRAQFNPGEPAHNVDRRQTMPVEPQSNDTNQSLEQRFQFSFSMDGRGNQHSNNGQSRQLGNDRFTGTPERGNRMTPSHEPLNSSPQSTPPLRPSVPLQSSPPHAHSRPSYGSGQRATSAPYPGHDTGHDDSCYSKLSGLGSLDTALIIDNTPSMQVSVSDKDPRSRWALLQESVQHMVHHVTRWDQNGIDIYFLNPNDPHESTPGDGSLDEQNVKDPDKVLSKFRGIEQLLEFYSGGTFFFPCLEKAIEDKLKAYKRYYDNRNDTSASATNERIIRPKALNIIFITDGIAHDHDEVVDYIFEIAEKLHEWRAPKNYIGIQFVQIGDDKQAAQWLKELDDELKLDSRVKNRDMIDTTPFNSPNHSGMSADQFQELLGKILLGAVRKEFDAQNNDQFTALSEDSGHPQHENDDRRDSLDGSEIYDHRLLHR